jgi:hypothetical protein
MNCIFKFDYKTFKKGAISIIFTSLIDDQEEEIVIFNEEIKTCGLIYLTNHWATFSCKMMEISRNFDKIILKITHKDQI